MESAQSAAPQGFFDTLAAVALAARRLEAFLTSESALAEFSALEARTLWICLREQCAGACQVNLADQLGLSAAHVSSLVETLRQRGYLVGERRPPDRRRQFWRITPEGEVRLGPLAARLDGIIARSAAFRRAVVNLLVASGDLNERAQPADIAPETNAANVALEETGHWQPKRVA